MKTPVAIIIFNRPDLTRKLIKALACVKPSKVYVISDGPRSNKINEDKLVSMTRSLIDDLITWPCEIKKNYATINMGSGGRVSSGLDWVFKNEEKAIILEDDCIPSPSFFDFLEVMLIRYQDDSAITHISGSNMYIDLTKGGGHYSYSRYPNVWGWATWRRSWVGFDLSCRSFVGMKIFRILGQMSGSFREAIFWLYTIKKSASGKNNTWDVWDAQWVWNCWLKNGLSICPNINLIQNIGFGSDATHTVTNDGRSIEAQDWVGDWVPPKLKIADRGLDEKRVHDEFKAGRRMVLYTIFRHPILSFYFLLKFREIRF